MTKLAEAELDNPPGYSVKLRKLHGSFGNKKTTDNIPVHYPFISVSLVMKDRRRSALQRKRSSTVGIRRDSMTGAKSKANAEMEAGVLNTEPVFVDVTPAGRYVCKWEGEVLTYPEILDRDMPRPRVDFGHFVSFHAEIAIPKYSSNRTKSRPRPSEIHR